jgi:MSHA biogenesis protein MshO
VPVRVMESRTGVRMQRGFTLVEMIIVIVITGIIASIVGVFILTPVKGYIDSVARAELTDTADSTLRRMARDLRLALPNSVRVTTNSSGNYLELFPTVGGGRYLAAEDGVSGNPLQFGTSTASATVCPSVSMPANCLFDVVGFGATSTPLVAGESIVVYNLGPGLAPADAYAGGNIAPVTNVSSQIGTYTGGFVTTVTLGSNPFVNQNPQMASPTHRFQIVTTPVTYYCNGTADGSGTLMRYTGYTIPTDGSQPVAANSPPLSTATSQALVAKDVVSCVFSYTSLANQHTALIGLTLILKKPNSNSGTVVLTHQVHVDNTP